MLFTSHHCGPTNTVKQCETMSIIWCRKQFCGFNFHHQVPLAKVFPWRNFPDLNSSLVFWCYQWSSQANNEMFFSTSQHSFARYLTPSLLAPFFRLWVSSLRKSIGYRVRRKPSYVISSTSRHRDRAQRMTALCQCCDHSFLALLFPRGFLAG